MADCRYFPECQRCNEIGDSWIPCAGGSDGTRCEGYEPMPDVDALLALSDNVRVMAEEVGRSGYDTIALVFAGIADQIRWALGAGR